MLRLRYIATGFFFLQAMEADGILDRLLYGEWAAKPGDKITQGLALLMISTSVYLFCRAYRRVRNYRVGCFLAAAVAGFMLLSVAWSADPSSTIRRGVQYLFVVLGAIGIAGSLEGDEVMELLVLTCGLSAFASIALLVVTPGSALMEGSTDLRGIFSHKNVLGQAMIVGVLASLHCMRRGGRKRWRYAFMLILFVIVALASRSTTSVLTIFAFCGMEALVALVRKRGIARIMGVALTVLLTPVSVLILTFQDPFLEMIGKDPTLTGRTELWAYVLTDISQRPLLGWGYAGFWTQTNPAATEISDTLRWFVPQAHNGLLEIMLNAGIVGATFLVLLMIRNIWLAVQSMHTPARLWAISCVMFYCGLIFVGFSETVMIEPFQPTTSMFFITGLVCERAVSVARRKRHAFVSSTHQLSRLAGPQLT